MAEDSLRWLLTEICPPIGMNQPKQSSLETSKMDKGNLSNVNTLYCK